MGKHNMKNSTHTKRNAAIVAAMGVGAAVLNPAAANAAPVTVPNTNYTVDVPNEAMQYVQPALDAANGALQGQGAAVPSVPAASAPANPLKNDGQKIVDFAMSKVGAPYVWGAAGPNAFDCSGLTSWAYSQAGKQIPRTSDAQAYGGQQVSLNALQPGDIVSFYSGASHVGIYIGDGKIVHALNESSPVRVDTLDYMPVNNAVRF